MGWRNRELIERYVRVFGVQKHDPDHGEILVLSLEGDFYCVDTG